MPTHPRSVRRLLVSLMAFAATSSLAQAPVQLDAAKQVKIDEVIQRCLREDGTPSASVALVEGGRIIYAAAFGNAVVHPVSPAGTSTRYQLASISKTFTAQSILLLEADGKLSLDDKVSKWYPQLTSASDITLRQILNHTSGYPDHYPQSYPAGNKGRATPPEQIILEWGRHPLLFPPGTRYLYSNLEYEIAGRIVEKVSGKPLFQFMQERIFRPLHMDAVMDLDTIPDGSAALATGYMQTALAGLSPAPYEGPGWSFGSGQVVTTAQDIARWDIAFMEHRVLPPTQAAEEITPARLANGSTYPSALGLFVSHEQSVLRYYHTGEGLGFEAGNMIYPDASRAIVVLTNTSVKPTYLKIADELMYLLVPPSPQDRVARALFAELQSGTTAADPTLSDDLKHYLSPVRLRDYSVSLASLGQVEAFSLAHTQTTDGLTSEDYDVIVGGRKLRLHLLLLPQNEVEDVTVTSAE